MTMVAQQKKSNFFLYVNAKSGLSMRESPSLESKKTGLLKFNTKIKIIKVLTTNFETIYDEGTKISSNWVLIENPENPQLTSYIFGGFLQLKDFNDSISIDTSDWVDYKLVKPGISLRQPKNWINITSKNNDYYQWNQDTRLITHEDGTDPTQIVIKETNQPFREERKRLVSKVWFKKLEEKLINEIRILKCTYFFENGCSNIIYLHKINNNKTKIVEISGTCNSHPKGYDETKLIVAESVNFLSEKK